jgi:hypothetical protein
MKCKKCGKLKRTLRLEFSICDCPLDEQTEKLLRELLKRSEEKKRGK